MADPKLGHLKVLLDQFLEQDKDITAPALVAASRHFKHPSDITRPVQRGPMFHDYRARQARLRELAVKVDKNAKGKLLVRLTAAERQLADVERQKELLVVAVRGMIRLVGNSSGLKGWQAMFADYAKTRDELQAMDIFPSADIVPLKPESPTDL